MFEAIAKTFKRSPRKNREIRAHDPMGRLAQMERLRGGTRFL